MPRFVNEAVCSVLPTDQTAFGSPSEVHSPMLPAPPSHHRRLAVPLHTGYLLFLNGLVAYEKFNNGEMSDYIPTDEDILASMKGIPQFPGNEI